MSIILGLGTYFFLVNVLSKQNHTMHRGMRNPRGLKVRRYAARLICPSEYLAVLLRVKASDQICDRAK